MSPTSRRSNAEVIVDTVLGPKFQRLISANTWSLQGYCGSPHNRGYSPAERCATVNVGTPRE